MPYCDNPKCRVTQLNYEMMEKSFKTARGNALAYRFYVGVLCPDCGYTYRISPFYKEEECRVQVEAHRFGFKKKYRTYLVDEVNAAVSFLEKSVRRLDRAIKKEVAHEKKSNS